MSSPCFLPPAEASGCGGRALSQQRSIYRVHYGLKPPPRAMAAPRVCDRQVAGHGIGKQGERYTGILSCNNGTLLKPILKPYQKREIDFYETVTAAEAGDLVELRSLIPKYYGCRKFTYNGFEQEYIVLEDLCERMMEPCIMDVKIGKRTWDPLATEQKIKNEESKYALCKQQYGFCIPGFQVYKISSGQLVRHDKEYGKKLHGDMVISALRSFLNGSPRVCRALVLSCLGALWRLQQWAGVVERKRSLRLFASSLLIVYDAAKLPKCCRPGDAGHTSNGGQHTSCPSQSTGSPPSPSPWTDAFEKLTENHSFHHNYDDELNKKKKNYKALLDELSADTPTPRPWATVKIIDFAHAFFDEDDDMQVDENFKEGIDSLVTIFEDFLKETDDKKCV